MPEDETEERIDEGHDYNASETPKRKRAGSGLDKLEMPFDGKTYTHKRHQHFLMTKENCDEKRETDTYISIETDVMFT